MKRGPVVWLIWDAAAAWATERLMAEGALPHLARLAKDGVRAAARPPWPNCQTPPSLATLFTGCWPRRHGIAGFAVPHRDPSLPITAWRSGFEAGLLKALPLWRQAVSLGLSVVLPHLPWVLTPAGGPGSEPSELYRFAAEAYPRRLTRARAWEFEALEVEPEPAPGTAPGPVPRGARLLGVAGWEFRAWEEEGRVWVQRRGAAQGSAPRQEGAGATSAQGVPYGAAAPARTARGPLPEGPAAGEAEPLCLDPAAPGTPGRDVRPWAVELEPGVGVWFWAYRRPGDGRLMLAHSGVWQARTWPEREVSALARAAGPFCGEGMGALYRIGAFGPRLVEGGDGAAEELLVRSFEPCAGHFEAVTAFAASNYPADLYVFYQPIIDDAEHELMGWCDPASAAFRPAVAERLWGAVREAYRMADRHLGRLMEGLGPGATVVLSSDHGMAGVARLVHVNRVLERAGMLAFLPDGTVDLSGTQALYHPANNGSLWVNADDRPGGIVPARRRAQVARRAARELWALRDPETGRRVFRGVYLAGAGQRPGWPWAFGDVYLVAEDGYDLRPEPGAEPVRPSPKSANHTGYPERRSLWGVFFARGPGLKRGANLGVVDNRDVAGLVCWCLGIQPPPGMEGRLPRSALG
ncbi:MAG: alkaline phosphatase family protein [Acetobacteraceae bacterium]|nr:alkaline phosphatase family protein [Acetobacteraceae bacterium]